MVVITVMGFSQGNPDLVLYPYDEDGNQCGNGDSINFPYLYFYDAIDNFQSYNVTQLAQGICVRTCPTTFTGTLDCYPTQENPACLVRQYNFYVSSVCN